MSAIPWVGQNIVEFIWGGFSVNNATLNRFFSLHFVLPFVLAALALMHLIVLHDTAGSGNPLGISGNYERIPFAPYYLFKDLITIFVFVFVISLFVFFMPDLLGDSENYVIRYISYCQDELLATNHQSDGKSLKLFLPSKNGNISYGTGNDSWLFFFLDNLLITKIKN